MKDPAERYKTIFRAYGVSQHEVAKRLNCSVGYISSLLNGYRPMSADIQMRLHNLAAEIMRERPHVKEILT